MKVVFISALALITTISVFGQNLVENPSFESVNTGSLQCSWYTSQAQFNNAINSWTVPTTGSTDIFNMGLATSCYCHPLSTHASSPGQQVPRTGNTMVNITVYGPGGCTPYREYIQGHLSSSLVPGQQYLVEFYVSFGDKGTYATNNIGVYFSTTQVNVASMCVYNVTPQLNYSGAPITNMTGWELISFTFTPTAAYNYFIIGNFYDDASTATVNMGGPNGTIRYFVDDVSITPISAVPTSNFTVTTPICDGQSSTITYTGTGTSSATYNWNWDGGTASPGTGQGPHSVTWPGPGTYTITLQVTENGQTSTITSNTVVVNPNPTATFTASSPVCPGANSTITYTGSAGSGATYTWDFDGGNVVSGSGQGPYQVNWTSPGTYNVSLTVTENGCSDSFSVPVTVNTVPTSDFTVSSPVCVGNNSTITYTGTAGASATYTWNFNGGVVSSGSGQGPYQVYWNNSGTYNVTLTVSENGCSSSVTTHQIVVNDYPTSDFIIDPILCYGDNTTITYTGTAGSGATYNWDFGGGNVVSGSGQGPITINWSNVGNNTVMLNVSEGGCTSNITTVNVYNPDSIQTNITISNVTCFASNNGSVSVNVSGGTPGYTYTWSNGTGTNFTAGNYSVTVTDANGCTDVENFTISQPTQLSWTTNVNNLNCYQDNTGSASISVNDGTPPYQYQWSNGVTGSNTINNLSAGSYTVTVTDANLCTFTETITVSEPAQLTSNVTLISDALCNGSCDGELSISGTGGTPPYTYLWSDGQSTSNAINLCAGSYTGSVIDNNGCVSSSQGIISQPSAVNVSISGVTDVSCNGICDGTATCTATGGTSPYSYSWSSGGNNSTATQLCPGQIEVTVTDANGCQATTNDIVNEPTALSMQITNVSNVTCYGLCDGQATATISGGTPPYLPIWSSGHSTVGVTDLCSGTYYVTVTDINGCSTVASTVITQPTELELTLLSSTDPSCYGTCDGSIEVSASGGTPTYTYLWSNNATTALNTDLCEGQYSVTVTDLNSCTETLSAMLSQPSQIQVSSPPDITICNGSSTNLLATATGGSPPYNFYWDNQLSNPLINVSPENTTTYSVYAVDNNGCTSTNISSTTVYVTQALQFNLLATDYDVCPGTQVMISPSITNGVPPFYLSDETGNIVNPPFFVYPDDTTTYTYTVEDHCGYTTSQSITINVYDIPDFDFSSDVLSGCQPLEVNFNYEGPEVQSIVWDFGDQENLSLDLSPNHIYEEQGVYDVSVTVKTVDGCSGTKEINNMINVFEKPTAKFEFETKEVSVIKPVCYINNLSILADTSYWFFGDGTTSSMFNPVHTYPIYPTGTYTVQLIVATHNGCRDTTYGEITVKNEYTFYAPTAFSPDNDGVNDYFYVYGNGIDKRKFQIYIYDRWGEIIYETDDIDEGWDGRVKGGEPAKSGTYTWLVKYYDQQGVAHEKSGAVTIIR